VVHSALREGSQLRDLRCVQHRVELEPLLLRLAAQGARVGHHVVVELLERAEVGPGLAQLGCQLLLGVHRVEGDRQHQALGRADREVVLLLLAGRELEGLLQAIELQELGDVRGRRGRHGCRACQRQQEGNEESGHVRQLPSERLARQGR